MENLPARDIFVKDQIAERYHRYGGDLRKVCAWAYQRCAAGATEVKKWLVEAGIELPQNARRQWNAQIGLCTRCNERPKVSLGLCARCYQRDYRDLLKPDRKTQHVPVRPENDEAAVYRISCLSGDGIASSVIARIEGISVATVDKIVATFRPQRGRGAPAKWRPPQERCDFSKQRIELHRFLESLDIGSSNECWPWRGVLVNGYGMFTSGRSLRTYAHRYAYERFIGKIAKKASVIHTCDNRACCNPAHLRLATSSEIILSSWAARGKAAKAPDDDNADDFGEKPRKLLASVKRLTTAAGAVRQLITLNNGIWFEVLVSDARVVRMSDWSQADYLLGTRIVRRDKDTGALLVNRNVVPKDPPPAKRQKRSFADLVSDIRQKAEGTMQDDGWCSWRITEPQYNFLLFLAQREGIPLQGGRIGGASGTAVHRYANDGIEVIYDEKTRKCTLRVFLGSSHDEPGGSEEGQPSGDESAVAKPEGGQDE